jgi:hypothetical protein
MHLNMLLQPLTGRAQYTPEAVDYMENFITPEMTLFETGAGASTLWYAGLCERVVTYEHDLAWYSKVKVELKARGIKNVRLVYSTDYRFTGIPESEGRFDVVCVDGRGRVKTIETMRDRAMQLLMLDDSQRPKYAEGHALMDCPEWEKIVFKAFPVPKNNLATTIWRRN